MHAGLVARPRRHRRDDGRRPPEPAGGHPEARRGGRGGLRRRERPARGAARLVGPDAPVAADQRDAAPLHGRRHLRLRLRVQRLPPRRGRADARRDRQAEVHEGARPLRRRDASSRSTSATRRAQGASRYSPLRLTRLALHVLAGFWPQPIQRAGVVLGVVCSLASLALGIYGLVYWIDEVELPRPALRSAPLVVAVLGVQGFILALVGEYLGRIQRDVEHRPLYLDRSRSCERSASSSPAAPGSSRRTSSATCSSDTVTRSSRSTRSPTRATSRTSPT